ncbi:GMC oxidoreductase-domain-containing protein [Suillus fuscotomentosus]|uniref:GMC oxidoreductase-domain-containing protein n=1 Tax=Suillus fuscotomentosus TaxID=1912939 RepID=A0AAD4EBT2_9AGAM|nr:GMC oxidoreductase-domain-containing protein [Suillus fuscotomentosus]KAG1903383.1 GMC oxidoreductase-domain-containing protein [Suillus fuscotomentosus]
MFHPVLSEFDIVFAGGGTTACVVAGRLAAYDPSLRILILEAGQHSLNKPIHVQPFRSRFNHAPTSTTVTFNIGNPSPRLNDRVPIVPCGRCVGGGSCVNSMIYTRAPASDYDDWGVNGWESENLIPLMKKLETYEVQPDCPTHGYDGPIKVSSGGCKLGISDEFIQVGTTYHKRQYADDTDDLETCNTYSPCQKYIDGTTGRRSDTAHHYVYNQAHNPNLHVWDGKRVKCIIFEGKRAVGVEFINDPVSCPDADQSSSIARASKLVIISAGAFGSPTILERSGIGAKAILKRCGIEQVVNLPGVGENYQDHNLVFVSYLAADEAVTMDPLWRGDSILQGKHTLTTIAALYNYPNVESLAQWNSSGKSLIAQNGLDSKIKWRPDDEELKAMDPAFQPRWKEFFQDRLDKAVAIFAIFSGYVQPLSRLLSSTLPPRNYMSAAYYTLYPASVGSVHINVTENGKEAMDFTTGFLDDPSDIVPLNFAYKKTREIFRRMASYRGEVTTGHPDFPEGSAAGCREASGPVDLNAPDIFYTTEDDEAIDRFHRDIVQTTYHSLGTCAMKSEADQGVVDARLNVYGVSNLKVADMSISPLNVGTNTYSTALLIGERAAMIIAEDLGINCI